MAQPPPDVSEDECLPEYRHLFCPDLLRDKVAFITGGGSGIGFRIAEIFMRHGCHTIIASRSLPRVSMAARKLAAATGRRCLPLSLDVRAPPAITAAVDQALKEFGKIDILINCAAGNFLCPASTLSFNAFKTVMDIDTLGTFNTSRVLYEKFFRDHGGVIVNITATLGSRGQVLQVHAGSAKAAVDAMTRHLAVEWGPQNIRVNSLAPGLISGTEGFWRLDRCLRQRRPSEGNLVHNPSWDASCGALSRTCLPPTESIKLDSAAASESETGLSPGSHAVSTFPPPGPISRAWAGVTRL
ncbi:peroxisomal 2,4-dienoyl-CoA reductase [(3E)-enoyl-CoA-producing] isoform X3 [Felis catus]|uniref:Peroxisomal 2,4-dienoyl-CoA reductase [(3E)-enoyl-CoA-producing] n=1 Tax=Felis catus TaxID=9685 RepID=A0ABI7WMM6_FELCA|nr:peroxisomal 2,4-dienoyl-CoA reductase [(3E)-enoyl-CoA-producing] isoform X3 [Felis catus]